MKKLILILLLSASMPLFSQNYYDQQWKKVEENYKKGTYKSNLPIILEIQNQAVKENNVQELIKSLKAEFSIINQTNDDTQNDSASKFFAKLKTTENKLSENEKLLFNVLLGEFINDYYQNNSWKINQLTSVNKTHEALSLGEGLGEDIETWSKLDFKNYLSKHFSELEKQNSELRKITLAKYSGIFTALDNSDYFPTLADWNNYNYIEFLKNKNLFTPNEIKVNFAKINSIYDEEIALNSGNPKLYFGHQKINYNCEVTNCKDRLQQLENLVKDETNGDYKVLVINEIMDILQSKEEYKSALIWAEKAKEKYPKSKFINNITNKENAIKNPQLNVFYETQTQSNKPIHLVAQGRNVNDFSLNIYEVKSDFQGFLDYVFDSYQSPFSKVKKSLVRKENFTLPETSDFKIRKTSLELKPLPAGIYLAEYIVENSIQRNFYFIVSDSRIIYHQKDEILRFAQNDKSNREDVLKLVNNENGKIFADENLEISEYVRGKQIVKHLLKTDKSGNFQFPKSANKDYYRYYLVKNKDNYALINVYGYDNDGDGRKFQNQEQAQIFLDRAIYRPAQTVYFKIVATGIDGKTLKTKTLEKVKLNVVLNDANYDEVSKIQLVTNEFGSVNGSFTLPKGKLNGRFTIEVDNDDDDAVYTISGSKFFQVEEYKRPKFEVEFEPVKEEYKYGQTIELKGKAMMFSGVPLSNSTVNYEIKKQNIRWRYFWWYPRGNDNENSILGEAKTNEKGEFTIKIDLKKDETLDGIQIDNYAVNASVTDINGETQSAETSVKVASVSHYISLSDAKDIQFSDENIQVKVETKNYNDQNLQKSYNVKLSKLEEPNRVFRDNFSTMIQNFPVLTKEDFVLKFPHDRFDKSENRDNWKVEKVIYDKKITPKSDNLLEIFAPLGERGLGTYKLELYNIEGKDTIKTEKTFEIFDKTKLSENQKPFLKVISEKSEYKRGEKAKIYIYSAVSILSLNPSPKERDFPATAPLSFGEGSGVRINIFLQNGKGETVTETKTLKNGILVYETEIPKDENISQLNVQFQLVAFNDVQTETVTLPISDSNKDLKIETVTFRDKLQPSQKEKWTVKVSGSSGQAEMLANMYDKSLDKFAVNYWNWQKFSLPQFFARYDVHTSLSQQYYNKRTQYLQNYGVYFPQFNWFDGGIVMNYFQGKVAGVQVQMESAPVASKDAALEEVVVTAYGIKREKASLGYATDSVKTKNIEKVVLKDSENIKIRENLNETAFFYPNLLTDKDGNVSFEFTSPEALTAWKVMFLAHNKNAEAAVLEKTVITQKEFSVTPNYPRFLREGDELNLQTKLSNLTAQKLNGVATLQILDAFTNEDITEKFGLIRDNSRTFELKENGNSVVNWKLKVPNDVSSIILKVVAKAGNFSDGEQKAIAVLPNRMLVTDAVPVFVKEGQTKTFVLENLKNADSKSISNVSNTLELTTNPIWEIMFALPSLKNDQNNSADVIFNKWFADVLASEIFKANPKMKTVFDEYQNKGLLISNLEKNQELKQLLLEETPWVLESKNETEQMEKLARLFDANTMRNSIQNDWSELVKMQNPDGGFSWYSGYPSSYYTSLYILKNLGKINEWLKGNVSDYQNQEQKEMVKKLVSYVDNENNKYFDVLNSRKQNIFNNYVLDYLNTRHYWEKEYPLKGKQATLKTIIISKAKKADIKDFTFFGLHRSALLFDNYGLKDVSKKLLNYLKETSAETETQGVYWKQNLNDWGWYSSKTVNQAGALEAFQKLTPNDENFIEEMKIWLVTQKEVGNWGTSRNTAEVIFTILNSGKSWTSAESDKAEISWKASPQPSPKEREQNATGYFKKSIVSDKLDKDLATVTVKKDGAGIVQGGLFWQYYEDLDKIKSSETYISVTKELYKKIKTENGEELQKITEKSPLKVGDKVTVRLILNTDRNMEFIHLKDMRGAGFEPLDVISKYQWKNNLGYYQSTKDASTNFYIEYMPKGKYVFEYDYICNASGTFSNGITTLQNYYAPQMNAHTKGTRVEIGE
ncbi:MAG: alpha-2-macroglobulin family protein [Bergeyella sp.]